MSRREFCAIGRPGGALGLLQQAGVCVAELDDDGGIAAFSFFAEADAAALRDALSEALDALALGRKYDADLPGAGGAAAGTGPDAVPLATGQ